MSSAVALDSAFEFPYMGQMAMQRSMYEHSILLVVHRKEMFEQVGSVLRECFHLGDGTKDERVAQLGVSSLPADALLYAASGTTNVRWYPLSIGTARPTAASRELT